MTTVSLSLNDINVLQKIKDPESDPLQSLPIDASLPGDPNVDPVAYASISQRERAIVLELQEADRSGSNTAQPEARRLQVQKYRDAVAKLGELVAAEPRYASARNNRIQALRRLHGDAILIENQSDRADALIPSPDAAERRSAASTILQDAQACIDLLSPPSAESPISPRAARILASAHTQRAAIYHRTAKLLQQQQQHQQRSALDVDDGLREASWSALEFEEAASADFFRGGRYGSDIARSLAVSTNPTAKLCGEIVREARRREYGDLADA